MPIEPMNSIISDAGVLDDDDVNVRQLRDPIHDHISPSTRLWSFIDTPQFQRLRSIKQLGTSYYVWAGACHNRFEHCIGVSHLARKMATSLQSKQPSLGITNRDIECVEIAGLCHDLGHGPWSHVWDSMFIPMALPGTSWTHEQGSEMMLDYLIDDNGIEISKDDRDFVKALIAGEPKKCRPTEKRFLFDIVSNKLNGLDVDKFDYICRDAHMIGDQGNISLQRLIKSARVIDNQICYNIKDANQMFEICATRFRLHKNIYNHKTAKGIEYMIIDGLLAAEPYMHIANRVFDAKKLLHLTDEIKTQIEQSESEELAPARAIFHRIVKRNLYQTTEWKTIDWDSQNLFKEKVTPERIVEEAKKISLDPTEAVELMNAQANLKPEHVIVDFSPMHYGMKEKNPMDYVKFYSKRHPDTCSYASHGDYSTLMPATFGEVLMRVYVKSPEFYGLVQRGYRAVLKKDINPGADLLTSDTDTIAESLPSSQNEDGAALKAPLTPRRHVGRTASLPSFGKPPSSAGITFNKFATVDVNYTPGVKGTLKGRDASSGSLSRMDSIKEDVAPPKSGGFENGAPDKSNAPGTSEPLDQKTPSGASIPLPTSPKTPTPRTVRGKKRRSEAPGGSETSGGNKRTRRNGKA
ncbi:hypothetical protein ONZ45_g5413 [Pleurotus djamor]|nr:hypothetical protein ONZ45_g5413 [Pleurotus djamor]